MKRPDLTIAWFGIEFEWSVTANAYIADTAHGRWQAQRHANDDNQWLARFGPYAGNWFSSPEKALNHVWGVAMNAHARSIEYLKGLPR